MHSAPPFFSLPNLDWHLPKTWKDMLHSRENSQENVDEKALLQSIYIKSMWYAALLRTGTHLVSYTVLEPFSHLVCCPVLSLDKLDDRNQNDDGKI